MKLIITEKSEKNIIRKLLKEEFSDLSDKVNIVKKFLDSNFIKASNSIIGKDGRPTMHDVVIWVDKYKQPKQYLSDKDLFYVLQDEFKNIIGADEDGKHTRRDRFLAQCIKDWFYNKISKNGVLTMYEAAVKFNPNSIGRNQGVGNSGSIGFNKWGLEEAAQEASALMSQQPEILKHWDDINLNGASIIEDINFLFKAFNNKRMSARKNRFRIICDDYQHNVSQTSKDYFNTLRILYSTREAFKWCFICPQFAKGLDLATLKYIKHQYNGTAIANGKDYNSSDFNLFKTLDERKACLPYFADFMKNYVMTYEKSELKNKVASSSTLSPELNAEIEQFLDGLGYPQTKVKANMIGGVTNDIDDLDDF